MLPIGMVCYNRVHHPNRWVLKTAEEGAARRKTLRLKPLAIPAVYGSGGRRPPLRLGVQDRSLRAEIRYRLQRIRRLDPRLCNGNTVAPPASAEA